MVKVTVGNNVNRETVIVDSDTTLRSVLEDAGIDYAKGGINLDGSTLKPGDLDKNFDDFNIGEKCFLLQVVKADNAQYIRIKTSNLSLKRRPLSSGRRSLWGIGGTGRRTGLKILWL